MKMGNKYGAHRVIEPKGLLPQAAQKIDNSMEIYDNEILIDVSALNIDSASFRQLWAASEQNEDRLREMILGIVSERGKMQNPVTGSGGMLMGSIALIGPALQDRNIKVGDRIASLVSLSLTPLHIDEILAVHPEIDRVDIKGQAVLFESGIYAKLPDDMPEALALAALDVAGAPAQTANIVKPGDSVLILGAGGKSGMLCGYEAIKRVGPCGNVV
ncbi:MAG: L-erythro-3,5-diaminohexanoate dehydrogenase, partial [Chloroflexi bacterium]|nr:L-erythro-3,5-diaminohexanoate dehydrogenase [Chloroflexota bacterium]